MVELMTMRDIAGLARVQRPVVTVWRRRSRAGARPFPAARERRDGQDFFLREEVVAWLEETRHGNNPDLRADVASHSLLATGTRPDAEALSALLALRRVTRSPLAPATTDELLDLADATDPDDSVLFSELARAGDLVPLVRTVEDLVEAAWDEQSAHRRLVDARLATPGSALAQVSLTAPARRFLLGLFGPLTRDLGEPDVMDPTGCAVDVLAEVAEALELPTLVMDGDTSAHRLTRRQLILADLPHRVVERGSGDWSVTGPVAHLVVLPTPAAPASRPLEQLDLLDEIALQLDAGQLVLCLAPAATLTDPLDGEALVRRDQVLRDGHVRAIVRLPAGFRPAQAREHSAVWLLGPADPAAPAERRTLVADLAGVTLRECDGLADDLLAAWQGPRGARRRAWAHLRPVLTRDLISASSTLVPPGPAKPLSRPRTGADWAVRLRAADTGGRLAGYRFCVAHGVAEEVTLAQAVERGWARVLPGRRLDVAGLPAGNVPVLHSLVDSPQSLVDSPQPLVDSPQPLVEPVETRGFYQLNQRSVGVDRLALLAKADVELTEPGDVVFTVRPTPRAIVDAEGGSLVLYPARVLRVSPDAPLLPAAIAARINAATTAAWRTWTVAVVPDPDRAHLDEALTDLAAERARLVAELAALEALTTDLTTAVESRQLSITKENHGPTSH